MHVAVLLALSSLAVNMGNGAAFEDSSGCETNDHVAPAGETCEQSVTHDCELISFLRIQRGEGGDAAVKGDDSAALTEGDDSAAKTEGERDSDALTEGEDDLDTVTEGDDSIAVTEREDDSDTVTEGEDSATVTEGGDEPEALTKGDDSAADDSYAVTVELGHDLCCCRDVGHSVPCKERSGEHKHQFAVRKNTADMQKGAPHVCCKFNKVPKDCPAEHPHPANSWANGDETWCEGGSSNHDPRVTNALGAMAKMFKNQSKLLKEVATDLAEVTVHHAVHAGDIINTHAVHEAAKRKLAERKHTAVGSEQMKDVDKRRAKKGQTKLQDMPGGKIPMNHHEGGGGGHLSSDAEEVMGYLDLLASRIQYVANEAKLYSKGKRYGQAQGGTSRPHPGGSTTHPAVRSGH
eukprot:gnl/TRDRNA2_/TRDRNA2_172436_c1_seq4.p1 gnl/TRDRNA2_/TRDRNA2_172436_c1~~gnl/TRDRNA2_/TRDRNA2_172436_c1_seq4.p1  ORF type:complete len:406 (+),score=48.22 gnl/TRDRNA2_/TRDRNA2_172436_c1_seq4:71-1288(+)